MTSSKKTSLNSASPEICRRPRTVTPSASIGTMNIVRPLCLGTSVSVRASVSPYDANWALVVHTFWPLSVQVPSSPCLARLWTAARSEPAAGSENIWHQTSSPWSSGPR